MDKTLKDLGEFGLIECLEVGKAHFRNQKNVPSPYYLSIGDDTAILNCNLWYDLLFTTDMLVEGVHFTKDACPEDIGHKALACNISDVAAMGGTPMYAVVSLGLPANLKISFVKKIYQGINRLAGKFDVIIVGGDTVKSSKIVINIALLGKVKKNKAILRSGAKAGDIIFVTGKLGNSLKSGYHFKFIPRIEEAQFLVNNFKINSMIDISDGLLQDLGHILKQSKVGAVIDEDKIPLRKGAKLNNALYDGEDFELIFTCSKKESKKIGKSRKYSFFQIGCLEEKTEMSKIVSKKKGNVFVENNGFSHF